MRDYFSGGVSFGGGDQGGCGFYVSVLPKLFVYTVVYTCWLPTTTTHHLIAIPNAIQPSPTFVFHHSTIVSIEKRPERIEFHQFRLVSQPAGNPYWPEILYIYHSRESPNLQHNSELSVEPTTISQAI